MLIINYEAGRFANRLFHFSHFIVNSLTHDYTLIYPYFDEFAQYFDATDTNIFPEGRISLKFSKNKLIHTFLKKTIALTAKVVFKIIGRNNFLFFHRFYGYRQQRDAYSDLNDAAFLRQAKKSLLIVEGWRYRDKKNFGPLNKNLLRKIFTPKKIFLEKVKKNLEIYFKKNFSEKNAKEKNAGNYFKKNAKDKKNILIGVHIRRTDYETFENGKWFYSDKIYAAKMYQFQQLFLNQPDEKNKNCTFWLCSDEPIVTENFKNFDIFFDTQPHFISDLYTLAQCDYIIGPPSTYSMWASFYGEVPLFKIFSATETLSLEKFEVVEPALEP